MKSVFCMTLLFLAVVRALPAGQATIVDFNNHGLLTWSNPPSPGSYYSVEWAPQVTGPWYRGWQGPDRTDADVTTLFTVSVPMYFRVMENQGPPPPGMSYIEAGVFAMGDQWQEDAASSGEWVVHQARIDAFYIDKNELTQKLWDKVAAWGATNGYTDLPIPTTQALLANVKTNHMPLLDIRWYDAAKWCNARSEMEGLVPVYYAFPLFFPGNVYRTGDIDLSVTNVYWEASGYRLPTEAEWEKAARGGLQWHHFPWPSYGTGAVNFIDGSMANYLNSGDRLESFGNGTTPVGWFDGFQPNFPDGADMANGYGLYDMAGNMPEWCWDWFDAGYYTNAAASADNPKGPNDQNPAESIEMRVIRGGGDTSPINELRCASRSQAWFPSSYANFRCIRKAD